ncbi:MAG TPA: MMPL family transporter [Gaiellaceae bacterium]|nr:MMPL family transporter [Gaiellaceae bacterium]
MSARNGLSADPFGRLGYWVYGSRKWIVGAWVLVLLVGGALAPKANGVLKAGGIEVPGSDSATASRILSDEFNVSALNNLAVVFQSPTLKVGDPAYKAQVKAAAKRAENAKGVTRVITYYKTLLPTLVSKDRHTQIMFVSVHGNESEAQTHVQAVRDAVAGGPVAHYVTGAAAVNHDFQKRSEQDLKRSEAFTFAIVLLLLLLTFRTVVSSLIPLVLGAAAVVTASAIIYLIGRETDTSLFALNVASMIGLGLAIDFSLIVVNRFREELAARNNPADAVAATMATAGRSIVYSGVTVLLGMLVLTLLVSLMVIRSISLGVMLVATTALLAGVTLLPAVLGLLAHRVERLRVVPRRAPRPESEGFWYRLSHAIMRRPGAWLIGAIAFILILAAPVGQLKLLGATAKLLPSSAESVKGSNILDDKFGTNLLNPIQIVLKTPAGGVFTPKFLTGLDKLSNTLAADPRASSVSSLATYMAAEPRDGRYQHLRPNWDFWKAPDLSHATATNPTPGVHLTNIISVWVDKVPYSPAYFGFGRFDLAAGTDRDLKKALALQIYKIEKGDLTVRADHSMTMWRKQDFNRRHKDQTVAAGETVTLHAGDQLVVQPLTVAHLRVAGAPVQMIVATSFHVRPGNGVQTDWQTASPTNDPFEGIPRTVLGGGLGETFPKGTTHVILDLAATAPGARFPRHMHPGPELIVIKSGTLTIFSSPEMVITRPNGYFEEGRYDAPTPMPARSKAVVQGYGIHRAINFGKVDTDVYSLRFLDATKPEYFLVALREFAKQFVNLDSGSNAAVINVVPKYGPYDNRQEDFVKAIRTLIIPSIAGIRGDQAYVGGQTANFMDFRHELYGKFPYLVGAVLLLTFLILMMFFQSVFLPLKAIAMNVLSILATFGVLVMIFQHGWGAGIAGFDPVGAIAVITPAILFVILFSLSTDYEVFMLSRIKEYYAQSHDNEESVARGLQHTGGIITAAGLILIGVFGSFATAGIVTIKEIGLGLAIGVLIDTVVVRTIMVPATMRLAGNINWTMPAWLKRWVPELREGPVEETPAPAPD